MSSYIDEKYVRLLQPKLEQFKQKGQHLWNCRCPLCGDSKKNKLKARGYIYERQGCYNYMCHNCGAGLRLSAFIKQVDPALYSEYKMELFKKDVSDDPIPNPTPFVNHLWITDPRSELNEEYLVSIKDLPRSFYARKYIEDRKIPIEGLYYTNDFYEYIKSQFPTQDKPLYREPRIVIPFYNREGTLMGVQGRAIGDSKVRYIAIGSGRGDSYKIFGWDKLDLDKPIYVVEGPFDSLFLNNAVATMDAALYRVVTIIGLDYDYVFVYDNERRNSQIISNMKRTIERGFKVCVWPNHIKEKDINDMVLAGRNPAEIQRIIDTNTFEGMKATMMLNLWSKI